jgi:hypothetical protein
MSLQDKLEKLNGYEISQLYKKVFDGEEGKLVLHDLTNRFNPTCPDVPEDDKVDPYRAMINIGKRSVMFHIQSNLERTDVEIRPIVT